MGRPKKVTSASVDVSELPVVTVPETLVTIKQAIGILTHEFGNGDMNILRDKINEIIKSK